MKSIGAFEAKTHFSSLLKKVEQGEKTLITKNGRSVAYLSPVNINNITPKEAVNNIKKFQASHKLILNLDWKKLREEGRK